MATANETQVAGTHYKTAYQHWDLVWDAGMGYFPGQITKYISRHSKKNGLQDVQKALHFATKYAELLSAARMLVGAPVDRDDLFKYLNMYRMANIHLSDEELEIIRLCVLTHDVDGINKVVDLLESIEGAYPGPGYVNQGD